MKCINSLQSAHKWCGVECAKTYVLWLSPNTPQHFQLVLSMVSCNSGVHRDIIIHVNLLNQYLNCNLNFYFK